MPQSLKFTLSGKQAMFKKPDVNEKTYFTYNNIHKVALIGMIGAILGLNGWRNHKLFGEKEPTYPEFYQVLHGIEVAIIPQSIKGYFSKKIQYFNNSVGYASKEEGGNLQVFEQVLENPSWLIYLSQGDLADDVWNKVCDMLLSGKTYYIPYLGKNDYHANIQDVQMVEIQETAANYCHSLFPYELRDIKDCEDTYDEKIGYLFTEIYPIALHEKYNFYLNKRFVFTNFLIPNLSNLFTDSSKNLCFF